MYHLKQISHSFCRKYFSCLLGTIFQEHFRIWLASQRNNKLLKCQKSVPLNNVAACHHECGSSLSRMVLFFCHIIYSKASALQAQIAPKYVVIIQEWIASSSEGEFKKPTRATLCTWAFPTWLISDKIKLFNLLRDIIWYFPVPGIDEIDISIFLTQLSQLLSFL